MTAIYRGMDRAALDAAYDNTAAVADSQTYRARWWETSAVGAAKAPLFVFIHGGYWQRNEKERFAFVASGPRAHGIDVVFSWIWP
jgi:arylformamidase